MNYWSDKKARKNEAISHTYNESICHKDDISYAINNSVIYNEYYKLNDISHTNLNCSVILLKTDSVSAIRKMSKESNYIAQTGKTNMTVLNFASYKNPGGMYIVGSSAQEESLCAESYLYNVLSDVKFVPYYRYNCSHSNSALYLNRAIMTPFVLFNSAYRCNVLTCAAPNYTAAHKYYEVTENANYEALCSRIKFVLKCCADSRSDILILGAYGCGVFGQDARCVAKIFKEYLENEFKNAFQKVIFAIPDDKNYQAFSDVFESQRMVDFDEQFG